MHAVSMVHRALSACCPFSHAKRLTGLCDAAQAAAKGHHLSLSELGRELPCSCTRHNIKRIDRLLGNTALHDEMPLIYQALAQQYLTNAPMPLVLIDWSDLTPDRHWQLLRASIALSGRSITLYEQVHPLSHSTTPKVHAAFLAALAAMLPVGCFPILVTNAGFRSSWFRLVNRMGWYWIGRIRNRDLVRPAGKAEWVGCKTLYPKAGKTARSLGAYEYVRNHPVRCQLVLIKRSPKGRRNKGVQGKPVRSNQSLKHARREREPWLLAVCPALSYLSADTVVHWYAQRMQIEESFRDLKSERFGLGLSASRSRGKDRWSVLLLIAALASFILRLIGQAARNGPLERQCVPHARASRTCLSVISLARQIIRKRLEKMITRPMLLAALESLQQRCNIPPI